MLYEQIQWKEFLFSNWNFRLDPNFEFNTNLRWWNGTLQLFRSHSHRWCLIGWFGNNNKCWAQIVGWFWLCHWYTGAYWRSYRSVAGTRGRQWFFIFGNRKWFTTIGWRWMTGWQGQLSMQRKMWMRLVTMVIELRITYWLTWCTVLFC